MVRVLAIGYESVEFDGLGGQVASPPPNALAPPGSGAPPGTGLAEVADRVDRWVREGSVVAIYPSWDAARCGRVVHTVRSALETSRLICYASDLPPLAGSVLAAMAASSADRVEHAGTLASLLEHLEEELVVAAHLRSVAGLEHLSPSVIQHFLSWMPWTRFWARTGSSAEIKRAGASLRERRIRREKHAAVLAVHERGKGERVRAAVEQMLPTRYVSERPATEAGARWWGTDRLVEVVAYPRSLDRTVARLTTGSGSVGCRWCHRTGGGASCPYCHMVRRGSVPAREAA